MKDLIKKLVEATGPSGYESEVREILKSEIEQYADEITVDALGNLIARKGEVSDSKKKIMMAGHMDEIGVMVTNIDENGFLRFTTIGGVSPYTCFGGRVKFTNGTIGVIGAEGGPFTAKSTINSLFIDVGATSPEDCPVSIGDAAGFLRPMVEMGTRLVSKAMDDRIATAIIAQALKEVKDSPHTLYFVFTTQEEVGLRGATTSAYGIDPDYGIAVDVTPSLDIPDGKMNAVKLGKGPAIKMFDRSLVVNPKVVEWMKTAAENSKIPYQLEVLPYGGTDAGGINLTRAGVPSGCISVPNRYTHSPSEMVDINDVENSVKLLLALISNPVSF